MKKEKEVFRKAMSFFSKAEIIDMFADFVLQNEPNFYGQAWNRKGNTLRLWLLDYFEKRMNDALDEQIKKNPFRDINEKSAKELHDMIARREKLKKEFARTEKVFHDLLEYWEC